jgi:hypothetical protein
MSPNGLYVGINMKYEHESEWTIWLYKDVYQ